MGQIIIIIATIVGSIVFSIKSNEIKSSLFESHDMSHVVYEEANQSNQCDYKINDMHYNFDLILKPIPTIIDMIDSSQISLPKYSIKINSLFKIEKQIKRGITAIL